MFLRDAAQHKTAMVARAADEQAIEVNGSQAMVRHAVDEKSESESADQFREAAEGDQPSFLIELWQFLKAKKAWWMIPILLSFTLIVVTAWLSSSALAPFIYPLF